MQINNESMQVITNIYKNEVYYISFKIVTGALCSKFYKRKTTCSVMNEVLLKSNWAKSSLKKT